MLRYDSDAMRALGLLFLLVAALPRLPAQETRLQQIIQSRVSDHSFMGSVLIAKGDHIVLSQGYAVKSSKRD